MRDYIISLQKAKSSKYMAEKTVIDNISFDSKKEAERYCELKLMQKSGAISDLELQKVFVLIPAQYDKKRCIERSVVYRADFAYTENGHTVVEDVKGIKTKDYIIKRKLMLYMHKIKIKEI